MNSDAPTPADLATARALLSKLVGVLMPGMTIAPIICCAICGSRERISTVRIESIAQSLQVCSVCLGSLNDGSTVCRNSSCGNEYEYRSEGASPNQRIAS